MSSHHSLLFLLHLFFPKLIRPHTHAVEILYGQHLIMNVYDLLSCCSMSFLYTKQNVKYQVVFFCHLFHMLQKATSTDVPPLPRSLLAHEVHLQCTTRNEGSLYASMKFNLRWE